MQKRIRIKTSYLLYWVLAVLFFVFSAGMLMGGQNDIRNVRSKPSFAVLHDIQETVIPDAYAPMGMRKQYTFTLEGADAGDTSLLFYIVHMTAKVQLDEETVYTLSVGSSLTGNSPSSNWVIIPLYPSDNGRQVTVTITPIYQSAVDFKMEFFVGSKFAVLMDRFKRDLPQIMLAALSVLIGLMLISAQVVALLRKRTRELDIFYLGAFSMHLGIWRLCDTRFSAIMFTEHAKAIGYIALFSVFVMPVPLLLYIHKLRANGKRSLLKAAAILTSLVAITALVLEVVGIADLRKTLPAAHVMLVLDVVMSFIAVMFHKPRSIRDWVAQLFVMLIIAGCITDLILYYCRESSSGMTFTLGAFLLCALCGYVENSIDLSRKAYMDSNTRLFNRTRWDKYLEESIPNTEPVALMMLDLNNLKNINDTLGHEVGDRIIAEFAGILRQTFGKSAFLCRWGGDEFAVLVRDADKDKLTRYVQEIRKAVDDYNSRNAEAKIFFACGYALSEDYPNLSKQELLAKADDSMYQDKQHWYDENSR